MQRSLSRVLAAARGEPRPDSTRRGPELRADAPFRVFAFGGCEALGLGVAPDESWPWLVALREARRRGHSDADVGFSCFAAAGSSNAAIARQIVTRCAAVRPDLALVHLAPHRRTEALFGGRAAPLGAWMAGQRGTEAERARAFLRFCDADQGLYESLRAVLLAQSTLAVAGVEAVAVADEPGDYTAATVLRHTELGPLARLVDRSFLAADIAPKDVAVEANGQLDPLGHAAVADRVTRHLEARRRAAVGT